MNTCSHVHHGERMSLFLPPNVNIHCTHKRLTPSNTKTTPRQHMQTVHIIVTALIAYIKQSCWNNYQLFLVHDVSRLSDHKPIHLLALVDDVFFF